MTMERLGTRLRILSVTALAVVMSCQETEGPSSPDPAGVTRNTTFGDRTSIAGAASEVATSRRQRLARTALSPAPTFSLGVPVGGSVATGGTGKPAAAKPRTNRFVVKVRGSVDDVLARNAAPAGAPTVNLSAAATASPVLSEWITRHKVKRVAALHRGHLRSRLATGTSTTWVDSVRSRFSQRAARAPLGATLPDLSSTYVFELQPGTDSIEATLASLRAEPEVLFAEEDKVISATFVPNDPYFSSSGAWGQSFDDLWGLKEINLPTAWDTARGLGTVVAVVDTGVDYDHPDIAANIWTNAAEIPDNGIDDDGDGLVDDWHGWDFVGDSYLDPQPDNDPTDPHGHGTHVAGIIGATGNNSIGVIGVAWQTKIMALRGLDNDGNGSETLLATAIVYAADHGADVINASWGGAGTSQALDDAINYAHGLGVVFVAAAGNDSADCVGTAPANSPNAITVAAWVPRSPDRPEGGIADFSNWGDKLDVAAPGQEILSLEAGTGGYVQYSGTSMAAPHVSGLAALVLGLRPTFTSEQVRQVLRSSAYRWSDDGSHDLQAGYGRIDAAAAVAMTSALETHIESPAEGTAVRASVAIVGHARGPGFTRYLLEYGVGQEPTTWTTFRESRTPVSSGSLGTLNPATLSEGTTVVRLRAFDRGGRVFTDQVAINVAYVGLTSPAEVDSTLTPVFKPGTAIAITGSATGASFKNFRVEWAPGRDATDHWSSAGLVLTENGSMPVTNGVLAQWTPSASQSGEYTIRVSVMDGGLTRRHAATLYLEPDLLSSAWPRFLPNRNTGTVVPIRAADGTTRFLRCQAVAPGVLCDSIAMDGTTLSTSLSFGSQSDVVVGNLDPEPGQEAVLPDDGRLRIVRADLSLIRDIPAPGLGNFGCDQVVLADLDDDGQDEILAFVRDPAGEGWCSYHAQLVVYRGDGQLFSPNYPITDGMVSPSSLLAADLNGDGRKEVVAAIPTTDWTQLILRVFNADGTPFLGWPTTTISSGAYLAFATDLDRDGRMELVVATYASRKPGISLYVEPGVVRPGWPVQGAYAEAVADLDRDGFDEILAMREDGRFLILGSDGSNKVATDAWPEGILDTPVVADIDDDGKPEILGTTWADAVTPLLRAIRVTDGTPVRTWEYFGLEGRPADYGTATVGDFNHDGKVEVALLFALDDPLGGGWFELNNDGMAVYATGARFSEANADWPMSGHDPQSSRSRPLRAPGAHFNPLADAHVCSASAAGTNFAGATSLLVRSLGTGQQCQSFLRFPLGSPGGIVLSAKFRLFGRRAVASTETDSVYAVPASGSKCDWDETTITWNNKPALGALQGQPVALTTTEKYQEWDVTAFVDAQSRASAVTASFAVRPTNPANPLDDSLNSRESGWNQPELVILRDTPPSVARPAATVPSPTTTTAADLSVLGADDQGETTLTYTWTTNGSVPAPVTFSANGTNAAKDTTATFSKAGIYTFTVSIRDSRGQTTTSTVSAAVTQVLTTVVVTPASASLATGGQKTFAAVAADQFSQTMTPQPSFTWTVSGGGSISKNGIFTAGSVLGGPYTVTATSGSVSGTAIVAITAIQIEAENYTSMSGIGTEGCSEGGKNVMDVGNNDWAAYKGVDFNGITSFDARVASAANPGTIEFRKNSTTGTLMATCAAPVTGGWQTWTTIRCAASNTGGSGALVLVFHGAGASRANPNLNWIKVNHQ